jgi:uncharacterized SAM-binding protein YcdF (DUF218 family)
MKRSTKKRSLIVVLAIALFWPLVGWAAAKGLIVDSEVSHADAIVVMAGSATYFERAQQAAKLFAEGRAPILALTNDNVRSGWSVEKQTNPLFVERAADELKRHGVGANQIEIVPGAVTSTYDEAQRIRDYAHSRGWHSIIVVTSAYQSRRASWTLDRLFAGSAIAVAVNAAPVGEQSPSPATWWLSRFGWKSVAGEYVKLVYYRIKY